MFQVSFSVISLERRAKTGASSTSTAEHHVFDLLSDKAWPNNGIDLVVWPATSSGSAYIHASLSSFRGQVKVSDWQILYIWCPFQLLFFPLATVPHFQNGRQAKKNVSESHQVPRSSHRWTGRCLLQGHMESNCAISHSIPFNCWSPAAREWTNMIWLIVLTALVYL